MSTAYQAEGRSKRSLSLLSVFPVSFPTLARYHLYTVSANNEAKQINKVLMTPVVLCVVHSHIDRCPVSCKTKNNSKKHVFKVIVGTLNLLNFTLNANKKRCKVVTIYILRAPSDITVRASHISQRTSGHECITKKWGLVSLNLLHTALNFIKKRCKAVNSI